MVLGIDLAEPLAECYALTGLKPSILIDISSETISRIAFLRRVLPDILRLPDDVVCKHVRMAVVLATERHMDYETLEHVSLLPDTLEDDISKLYGLETSTWLKNEEQQNEMEKIEAFLCRKSQVGKYFGRVSDFTIWKFHDFSSSNEIIECSSLKACLLQSNFVAINTIPEISADDVENELRRLYPSLPQDYFSLVEQPDHLKSLFQTISQLSSFLVEVNDRSRKTLYENRVQRILSKSFPVAIRNAPFSILLEAVTSHGLYPMNLHNKLLSLQSMGIFPNDPNTILSPDHAQFLRLYAGPAGSPSRCELFMSSLETSWDLNSASILNDEAIDKFLRSRIYDDPEVFTVLLKMKGIYPSEELIAIIVRGAKMSCQYLDDCREKAYMEWKKISDVLRNEMASLTMKNVSKRQIFGLLRITWPRIPGYL